MKPTRAREPYVVGYSFTWHMGAAAIKRLDSTVPSCGIGTHGRNPNLKRPRAFEPRFGDAGNAKHVDFRRIRHSVAWQWLW